MISWFQAFHWPTAYWKQICQQQQQSLLCNDCSSNCKIKPKPWTCQLYEHSFYSLHWKCRRMIGFWGQGMLWYFIYIPYSLSSYSMHPLFLPFFKFCYWHFYPILFTPPLIPAGIRQNPGILLESIGIQEFRRNGQDSGWIPIHSARIQKKNYTTQNRSII